MKYDRKKREEDLINGDWALAPHMVDSPYEEDLVVDTVHLVLKLRTFSRTGSSYSVALLLLRDLTRDLGIHSVLQPLIAKTSYRGDEPLPTKGQLLIELRSILLSLRAKRGRSDTEHEQAACVQDRGGLVS